jgi:LPXTG-site transpeptidase (sortase) family protein
VKRTTLSSLLIAAGALVLLAPLANWERATWEQRQRVQAFARQRTAAPAPAVSSPALDTAELRTPHLGRRLAGPPSDDAPLPIEGDFPPTGSQYRISIPKAGVDAVVVEGIEDQDLRAGAGHYPSTPAPGAPGNAAIAGHRTVRGMPAFFYGLNRLVPGDPILVTTATGELTFIVERVFITHAYDLSVLAPTPHAALTLTTCDPPGTDYNRLIVQARLTAPHS